MYFELDGKTYRIRFMRNGTTTFAELWVLQKDGELDFPGLMGIATLHPNDIFVKKIGRKVALASLLNRMEEVSAGDTEPEFILSHEDRKNIWEAYFKTHKK